SSTCRGLMAPVGLVYHSRKGYQIVHRCTACGAIRRNRVVESGLAPDDLDQLALLFSSACT
ncbi:MAG: RNHCP domain-containing protein, partial [Mycobacterium leprae]